MYAASYLTFNVHEMVGHVSDSKTVTECHFNSHINKCFKNEASVSEMLLQVVFSWCCGQEFLGRVLKGLFHSLYRPV